MQISAVKRLRRCAMAAIVVASTALLPSPGIAKTCSTKTVPPIRLTNTTPITVRTGMPAFRRACRYRIERPAKPLALWARR